MNIYVLIIITIIGSGIYVVLRIKRNNIAKIKAGKFISEMYPLWAEMGPYNTGEASGLALRCACKVVGPPDIGTKLHNLYKHAEAYDKDPKKWEDLRQEYLTKHRTPEFEEQLAIAKGMVAMHTVIDSVLKDAGFHTGFEKEDIGWLILDKNNINENAIKDESNRPDESSIKTIKYNIGNKLLEYNSFESDLLVSALKTIYNKHYNKEAEYIYEIGEAYLYTYNLCKTNAYDYDFSKSFYRLNAFLCNQSANQNQQEIS